MKERNKKRIRVRDKMRTLQKRKTVKTKIYQKYVYRGDTKINKKKEEIKKNTKIHQKLKRRISQEYSSSH